MTDMIEIRKNNYLENKTNLELAEKSLIYLLFDLVSEYASTITAESNVSGFSLKIGMITGELLRLHYAKWKKETFG